MAFRSYTFSSKPRSRSVILSSSTPFLWDRKRLRKYLTSFKIPLRNFFDLAGLAVRPGKEAGTATGQRKKNRLPLKPKRPFLIFYPPRRAARAPLEGPVETDAGGVRRLLVPSCSKEDLAMRTYDFTPLWRSTIGFDRFFDLVD